MWNIVHLYADASAVAVQREAEFKLHGGLATAVVINAPTSHPCCMKHEGSRHKKSIAKIALSGSSLIVCAAGSSKREPCRRFAGRSPTSRNRGSRPWTNRLLLNLKKIMVDNEKNNRCAVSGVDTSW